MATLYSSMISAHSRRLRTLGLVLLTAVLCMAFYGGLVFMPRLRENRIALRAEITKQDPNSPPIPFQNLTPSQQTKVKRFAKAQAIFVYAYWSFCGAMILALLVVAWLDAREVTRNYLRQQVALLTDPGSNGEKEPPIDIGS